ncbi:hypothetical protein [Leptothoe kymatousa]|uniref:Uncharacterized protein n=1 Tax=Leptothoe kymatousa TAU-MAC 1615 TaxID=2364775 RepID=A0ABS5Y5X6_9CYAN|nr:hypothetical protein [Leptothoe kymatousa]MBT9312749.1 hypothetical protein [Leptothoe kymatousa TAU-MAC 1615]
MFPRINSQRGNQKSQPAREPGTRGARTADSLLTLVNPAVAQEFSGQQWQEMRRIVNLAMGKPSPKIVDLNFTVDLIISRFYFRLLVGEDTRHKNRRQQSTGSRIGNLIAAVGLIIALNVVVSVSVVVIGYLVKSAIGVDLMPGHWRDWVMNRI